MNYTLSVYEKAMPAELTWAERLEACRQAGFDALEISVDETEERLRRLEWTVEQRKELVETALDAGVPIGSMCLSGHRKYPLGGAETCERGLLMMRRAVDFAADVGIRLIQLAGYDVYYAPSTPDTRRRFEDNLPKCVEMAAQRGVILGFETMETPFMNTAEKAMKYVRMVDSPYLGVYPDIGNISNGTSDAVRDLRTAKGRLFAAHLKETKPDVFRDMSYGEGCVDFATLITELLRLGVRYFNAEFWYRSGSDWQRVLKDSCDFLRGYFEKADTAEL